ncbi:FAD-linked oxidase C-terminal domain-containing protein [Micromonospora sp. B11E3]|uniref:FAD-binding oxidoreductase n=1 Tax=Micromonospora sp. B11E3 TaxID=3153562 RepID=UPI00325EE572
MTAPTPVLRDLAALLPADIVELDPDIVASRARDLSHFTPVGAPMMMLAPRTTAEVSACLTVAYRHGLAVVPRGAGTGLSGGANAPDGSVVVSLHRMNKILEINSIERLAVVQPGVVTGHLRERVAGSGLFYPPDPGSVDSCTIGGNVATNAGGMCCLKYGVTGDYVLGLEVVLADGRVTRVGRRTVKGVAGYDLTRLFVGSEGTLGVITEITLRLLPRARVPSTLVAPFDTLEAAGNAVVALGHAGLRLSMLEIMDKTTVQAVEDLTRMGLTDIAALLVIQTDEPDADEILGEASTICSSCDATETFVSTDPAEADLLLAARRNAFPALERLGDPMLDDVAVPRSSVAPLIAEVQRIASVHKLRIGVFGHAGEGNLHPTIIYDRADPDSRDAAVRAFADITAAALALGGTVTGEHGVGRLKTAWLARESDAVALALHRAVKATFDPHGTMNPGNVITAA